VRETKKRKPLFMWQAQRCPENAENGKAGKRKGRNGNILASCRKSIKM
jgi:hypothetical protein